KPDERAKLRAGKDVERLSVVFMIRAGALGYSSPWRFTRVSTLVNTDGNNQLFPTELNRDARKIVVNERIIGSIADDILSQLEPGMPGGVLIFARGVEKIDKGIVPALTEALRYRQRALGKTSDLAQVRGYHGSSSFQHGVDWLSDLDSPQ